jgi:hypothetical protein
MQTLPTIQTMAPDFGLAILIIVTVFSPLLAAPLMLGSFVITQNQDRRTILLWYGGLALLCVIPAGAAILAVLLGLV